MTTDTQTSALIWRDGDRIASRNHGGYNDMVPDANLMAYVSDESLHHEDRAFAALVLAFRAFERAMVVRSA